MSKQPSESRKRPKNMKEVLEGPLKSYINPQLIKAFGHPVREHFLAITNERAASATDLAKELETDVSSIHHHVEELEELGCIEEVGSQWGRGGRERFYRAKATLLFDATAWQDLPKSIKRDLSGEFVQMLFRELLEAVGTGAFDMREDRHVTWLPGIFDVRGWKAAIRLLEEMLPRLVSIQRESALRVMRTGEPAIQATFGMVGFQTNPDLVHPKRS